jgi:hypothetical protein
MSCELCGMPTKWMPISKYEHDEGEPVIVYDAGRMIVCEASFALHAFEGKGSWQSSEGFDLDDVTHFMPIPLPPIHVAPIPA